MKSAIWNVVNHEKLFYFLLKLQGEWMFKKNYDPWSWISQTCSSVRQALFTFTTQLNGEKTYESSKSAKIKTLHKKTACLAAGNYKLFMIFRPFNKTQKTFPSFAALDGKKNNCCKAEKISKIYFSFLFRLVSINKLCFISSLWRNPCFKAQAVRCCLRRTIQ